MADPNLKLQNWLKQKNWTLSFCDIPKTVSGIICYDEKLIKISNFLSKEEQRFTILHECGHLLLGQNKETYQKMFPIQNRMDSSSETSKKKKLQYRIEVLKEEILAWDRGRELAKRLKIKINQKNWEKYKSSCLFTYIEWAAKK